MVNVTDGAHIDVRFGPLKYVLCHFCLFISLHWS